MKPTGRIRSRWTSISLGMFVLFFALSVRGLGAEEIATPAVQSGRTLKRRVAVLRFEDRTDGLHKWWDSKSVGEGLSDMLTTALSRNGRYRVLERRELDAVLSEQKLALSGAVTEETAVQIGKLLNADLLVIGAVTEFGFSEDTRGGQAKGIALGWTEKTATVAIDVRFVSSTTGEVVAAEGVRKRRKKRGIVLRSGDFDFDGQREFDRSAIGSVAREAVDGVTELIDRHIGHIPWQGKVVKADGQIYINAGLEAGVAIGDRFVVYRPGEELIDPDTGLSLGSTERRVGEIEVARNNLGQGRASACKVLSGAGFQRGDIVREE